MTPPPIDEQVLRNAFELYGVVGVDDRLAVARPRLDVDGRRSGGDDHVLGLYVVDRAVRLRFDRDLFGSTERRLAVGELDAVRFEERLDAADVGVDDVVLELRDAFAVDFGARDLEADRVGVFDVADHLADVQQRLGRDAAPVQADAADLVAIEADDLLAELAEPDRGVIAAGPRADDDGIELVLRAHAEGFAQSGAFPTNGREAAPPWPLRSQCRLCAGILLRLVRPSRPRALPWRTSRTPYRTVVSEFMLVQTQVDRVMPHFESFVERFPDFASLAEATQADVLRQWHGLGYNSRAVRLHALGANRRRRHGGTAPSDPDELRALPGVGPYTVAAIRTFAFEYRRRAGGHQRTPHRAPLCLRLEDPPRPARAEIDECARKLVPADAPTNGTPL